MNFKEKNKAYRDLKTEQHAEADLHLLSQLDPNNTSNLNKFSRNPKFYSGDILYSLLELTDRDTIIAHRREWLIETQTHADNNSEVPADKTDGNTEEKQEQNPANNNSEVPPNTTEDSTMEKQKQDPADNGSGVPEDPADDSTEKDEDADASSESDEEQKKRS
jgi:hypothetical protein